MNVRTTQREGKRWRAVSSVAVVRLSVVNEGAALWPGMLAAETRAGRCAQFVLQGATVQGRRLVHFSIIVKAELFRKIICFIATKLVAAFSRSAELNG